MQRYLQNYQKTKFVFKENRKFSLKASMQKNTIQNFFAKIV